ncbi:hypothetical protein AURDEDRAFT_182145 [Auricularia subglabra TFB-10046 SS5]|nr:hypothetical protein AURDEDRAFT_182145 [Auricularia subglabra TFB-10046 SS5]
MTAALSTPLPDGPGCLAACLPPVTRLPFDIWAVVVDFLRSDDDEDELGEKAVMAVMSTCRHFSHLFEIFLYNRLEIQGPHIQLRIDREMLWNKAMTIYRVNRLMFNQHLRRTVTHLKLYEWGCPSFDPTNVHHLHHFLLDTIMSNLPDMTRLRTLRIHDARLDTFAYYTLCSLGNLDVLHLHNCHFTVNYVDMARIPVLSPAKLSIRDLGWHSPMRFCPLVNISRVRTFDTNSTELLEYVVCLAEHCDLVIPFVDVCLTNDVQSFSIFNMANSGEYDHNEILDRINRLLRRCARVLRLRVPPWVTRLDSLHESCPLLHSFYCATSCARAVLKNELLTTLEVYPLNVHSKELARAEMKSLAKWMDANQTPLPPIFTYMASYNDMEPLELLDFLHDFLLYVEILEIKVPDMHDTCPWAFNNLYRRHAASMPKLQTFVLGTFTRHEVPPEDALRQYKCWVNLSLAEWSCYCPDFVRCRLGEFAIWECYDDMVWRARFCEPDDMY